MSHLDPERLALLAIGEPASIEEQAHLDTCDSCALDLAELEHTVAVGKSTMSLGELEAPPERVWGRIADDIRAENTLPAVPVASPRADGPVPARSVSRLRRVLFTLAASVAIVLVGFGAWTLLRPTAPVEIATATLDAFPDHPDATGEAIVTESPDGERTVTVRLDDSEAAEGFREVWLITADATALVSLGELDGTEGKFALPADVDLRDYVLVDISQEPDDGDPAHSGDSIVRGELGFN